MMNNLKSALFLLLAIGLLQGCTEKKSWTLDWAEEFDYTGPPNPEYWNYELGHIRNHEMQYYTDLPQNVRVEEGICVITAINEGGDSVTSASINTFGKVDFLYGRIEVRAKIPSALGTWPAIWTLGTNRREVRWPACGEIDIMENVGYEPNLIHANIHTQSYNHSIGTGKGDWIEADEPWSDFHIYALEWFEDHMDFFFDDSLYFTFENDGTGNSHTWPFNMPQYLLLNLAYGGSWGGQEGVDTGLLPVRYEIDYVRYYKSVH
jgi:beta-glucanase (GH16 family)